MLPDYISSIGAESFRYNVLNDITIPDSVVNIGSAAFANNNINEVIIPDSVTSIGTYAFSNNNLTSITIPESVESIGYDAFTNNRLVEVNLPDSFKDNLPYSSFDPGVNFNFYSMEPQVTADPGIQPQATADPGTNKVIGSNKKDRLTGTNAADEIYGFDGNDEIFGKKGDDLIDAGLGIKNKVKGGGGSDIFVLNDDSKVIIKDFNVFNDFLSLDGVTGEISQQQRENKLLVLDDDGDVIARINGQLEADQINFI